MAFDETRLFLWSSSAVAASGVLWFLPGFNALSSVAAVTGLILIAARLGYMRAILASVIATAIVLFIGSFTMGQAGAFVIAALYLVIVIIPGVAMGVAARWFTSPARAIWYGFVPILFLLVLLVAYYPDIAATIPATLTQVNGRIADTIERSPSLERMLSEQYGPGLEGRERFLKEVGEYILFFIKITPGIIVTGFLATLVLGLMAAGHIGAKINLMIPRLRPFHLWRASDWWLVPTAVGLALAILAGDEFWQYVGGNVLVVTGSIYATTGLAVFESVLRRLSIPLVVRLIIYIIPALLVPIGLIFTALLAVLGLIDSRFNLRREDNEKNDSINEITDHEE